MVNNVALSAANPQYSVHLIAVTAPAPSQEPLTRTPAEATASRAALATPRRHTPSQRNNTAGLAAPGNQCQHAKRPKRRLRHHQLALIVHATESHWVCWRLLSLEARMEPWQQNEEQVGRLPVAIPMRRRRRLCGWCGRCAPAAPGAHHPARRRRCVAGRPRGTGLQRRGAEQVVGQRPDLRPDVGGRRVRVLHHRRVQPADRRLARRGAHAHQAWSSTHSRSPARPAGRTWVAWSPTATPAANSPLCVGVNASRVSPPCAGCTDTTPSASTATSATSRPQSSRRPTLPDKPTTHWLETNKPSLQQTQCDSMASSSGTWR